MITAKILTCLQYLNVSKCCVTLAAWICRWIEVSVQMQRFVYLLHVDDYQYNDLKGSHSACFALKSSKECLLLFTYLIYNFSDNITKCKSNSLWVAHQQT